MIIPYVQYTQPAAIVVPATAVRNRLRGALEQVMFGSMEPPCYDGTCSGGRAATITREYSGSTTAGTVSMASPPQSCSAILQQWEASGQVPAGDTCTCPPSATTPQCTAAPDYLAECQAYLASSTAKSENPKYEDCTCSNASPLPSCVSYYQLCEQNLASVQTAYDECSCSNPQTTTAATCVSDHSICEQNAQQYENSNTSCSCSQNSTNPTCCTTTTSQSCSTSQNCSTSQECTSYQVLTGYTCNSYGFYSIFCYSPVESGYETLSYSVPVPANFCAGSGSNTPMCFYLDELGAYTGPAISVYSTDQQCTPVTTCKPVTTCTPVTTQTCTVE